jgi:hypothetical protein
MTHRPDCIVDRGAEWEPDEELDTEQKVLVIVVDRKACEEGWVLLFALNHKGAVLPLRARNKAYWVDQHTIAWMGDGEPMEEMGEGPDDERELYMAEGDGWDYRPDFS